MMLHFCWDNIIDNPLLSFEWNSTRIGGSDRGIVIKTVHNTLPGGIGSRGWWVQGMVGWGSTGGDPRVWL